MDRQELQKRAQKALNWIDQRGEELEADEIGVVKGLSRGYDSFMTPAGETMLGDIEIRYGIGGKGLQRPAMPGGKANGFANVKGVKVHHGAHGEIFELSSQARLTDVIKSKDKAPVSLDRWLAATMLGDKCEDKAALDYATGMKSLTTGTTGVLLPIGYQADWTDAIRAQMVLQAAGKGAFSWKDGGEQWVSILPAHDRRAMPLGKARVYEEGDAAFAELHLNLNSAAGREWHSALKFDLEKGGSVVEWSYGFDVLAKAKEVRDGKDVRVLKRLSVDEVSPVVRGAGIGTRTLALKSRHEDDGDEPGGDDIASLEDAAQIFAGIGALAERQTLPD